MKRSVNAHIGSMTTRFGFAAIAAAALTLPAHAAPQGAQVVHGSASIAQSGSHTTITASDNAIINYSQFNVGRNESVRFVQPSASSRVLNRVTGSDPSRIEGSLSANGIVYLVNPAGIYFSQGAKINVAGLYAAAGHLTNSDFLQHIDLFKGLSGSVVNNGTIEATTANLLGKYVANHGRIDVPHGTLTMLAGHDVYLRNVGGHIMVKLDGKDLGDSPTTGHKGVQASLAANPAVDNSGSIDAKGSQVTLGAGDMYSLAVRNTGTIQAGSGSVKVAADDGAVDNAGAISASGHAAGSISMVGPNVVNSGSLAASSTRGTGGSVTVLGDHHTFLTPGSSIAATGINGGHVRIDTTEGVTNFMHGASIDVSATRHAGLAEVSGKHLAFDGSVDLNGATPGQLLLDPYDLTVTGTPGAINYTSVPNVVGNHYMITFGDNAGQNATVSASALEAISSGSITLEATHDLTVDQALNLNPADFLQLLAYHNLVINQPINNVDNLMLLADQNHNGQGDLIINAPITNVDGSLYAFGNTTYFNTNTIQSNNVQAWTGSKVILQKNVHITGTGVYFSSATVDGAHSMNITGKVYFGQPVGQTTPLTSLTVSSEALLAGGYVATSGDQSYDGDVKLKNDTRFIGNNVSFNSTLDGTYNASVFANNNITFGGQVGGNNPLNRLALQYGGKTFITGPGLQVVGDITFNSGLFARNTVPTVATIAAPNGDVSVVSENGSITMGQNEKFTDVGNLTLSAGNTITLGDVSTFGNMIVTAPTIQIIRRAAGQVLLSNGNLLTDKGTDLIASGKFIFSTTPGFVGPASDNEPFFASPMAGADANGNLGSAVLVDTPLVHSDYFYNGTVLDLTLGPVNVANALPLSALPNPLSDYVPEPVLLGPSGQHAMGQLALNVRPFSTGDLRAKLLGHQTIDDVSYTNTSHGVNATVYRVYRQAAKQAISRYQSIFFTQTSPAHGKTSKTNNTQTIRQSIAAAWSAYAKQAKNTSGKGFATFLAEDNGHKQALAYLQQLHSLLHTLRQTGLTSTELGPINRRIVGSVTPANLAQHVLSQAIHASFTVPTHHTPTHVHSSGANQQASVQAAGGEALARK